MNSLRDTTIYPGVTDLKFTNDTPAHILIQTKLVGSRLSVELYGSSDGRIVKLDGPYQYAKQSNGAMKAYFIRKITRNDQIVEDRRFDSIYHRLPESPLIKNPLE